MIKSIIILAIFFTSCTTAQPTAGKKVIQKYRAHWKTNSEFGVLQYRMQRSSNKIIWTTLAGSSVVPKYLPDSNFYVFTLPVTTNAYYYRLLIIMDKGKTYTSLPEYRKSTKN